ncbi:MAG: 50S ribosomal protein L4 [Actinomycetota bacterium]|nr:50S ribosomal protein L4 [Actinomycetota bacterium]
MTTIDILDAEGSKSGTVDLPAEMFDTQVNIPLIHQVVVAQLAAARQGTHDTKSRGEVAGGGRKPYRQKGTGRARQGSIRAPQFAGGGVVHGPTPRDYSQRTPKKMKAAALRGALSDRAREGRVHIVEDIVTGELPSTRSALALLAKLTERPRVLVVVERGDDVAWLSLRNASTVHTLTVDQLNTYDVLLSDDVVFTKAAYDSLVSGPSAARSTTAAPTSSRPEDADDRPASDEGPYGAGSAEPIESGDAPDGFTIKGNTTSMKYHQPDGRWYEQTEAEVWFASTQTAERAGFVEAGSKASVEATAAKEEGE